MYDQKYHINRPKKRRSGYVRFNRRHLLLLIWASLRHPMGCGVVCWYFWPEYHSAISLLEWDLTVIKHKLLKISDIAPFFELPFPRHGTTGWAMRKWIAISKYFTFRHIWAYSSVIICTLQQKLFEKLICSVLDTNPDHQIHGPTLWPLYHELMSDTAASKHMYNFMFYPVNNSMRLSVRHSEN